MDSIVENAHLRIPRRKAWRSLLMLLAVGDRYEKQIAADRAADARFPARSPAAV